MKFPKPTFQSLLDNYQTGPGTVHDCPRIYSKDAENNTASVNTCAIRMSEALVIANGLIADRAAIAALDKGKDRKAPHLLANYEYKNNLCPHGIARGARDLAYFLQEQWGKPTKTWEKLVKNSDGVVEPPKEIIGLTGVVAFVKLLDYPSVQGHMDLWNKERAVGDAYFYAEKVMIWKLE